MITRLAFVATALALLLGVSAVSAADLSHAKAQYAAASYEEALATLATLDATGNVEPINELRALCLLALGRTGDAERAVVEIVMHNPGYALDPAGVSPKLVTLFSEVRRRTLPLAARGLYLRAKASYDIKRWGDAKREFTNLMAVLREPDIANQSSLADLRQLGEGFLKLTETEYAAAVANGTLSVSEVLRAAAGGPVTPASFTEVPAFEEEPLEPIPFIYATFDRGVTPPVEQRSVMPRWTPPNRQVARLNAKGLLELIVDDSGRVERATMLQPTTPSYDNALVEVARSWRYVPAMKDGKPVHYRLVIQIVLNPGQ
jgi:TonB family protein